MGVLHISGTQLAHIQSLRMLFCYLCVTMMLKPPSMRTGHFTCRVLGKNTGSTKATSLVLSSDGFSDMY